MQRWQGLVVKYTRRNFLFDFKIGAIIRLIRPLPKGWRHSGAGLPRIPPGSRATLNLWAKTDSPGPEVGLPGSDLPPSPFLDNLLFADDPGVRA